MIFVLKGRRVFAEQTYRDDLYLVTTHQRSNFIWTHLRPQKVISIRLLCKLLDDLCVKRSSSVCGANVSRRPLCLS